MQDSNELAKNAHYKFRSLKVYASTEWLADNKKKYRQVFDRFETTYIYAELSFFNKYFDEEDWEVNVELRCYAMKKGKKELCVLNFNRKVNKYDPIVYIREGWGNKSYGAFWKKGTYYWEAWMAGEKVATKYFYVEDAGRDYFDIENAYLSVRSIRLYEGPYDDTISEERVYFKNFDTQDTRYIYAEIVLKNLNAEQNWQCELFTKFYNNARELKGQITKLQKIEEETDTFIVTAGWGSNVKGSWRADK
ncbi:MAG: AAA family ATPase, partial [Bacteroidota bacterium]